MVQMKRSWNESSCAGRVWRAVGLRHFSPAFAGIFYAIAVLAVQGGLTVRSWSQVAPTADRGSAVLSAGATGSAFTVQYGDRKMLGISAFIDAESRRRLGVEGEVRLLTFHQTAGVHASTYLVGPRFHWKSGRFEPYGKALIGEGLFTFPYQYAHGHYLVVAPGGGLDIRVNRYMQIRAIDAEYQVWPQFTFGSMTSAGVSAGVRFHLSRIRN